MSEQSTHHREWKQTLTARQARNRQAARTISLRKSRKEDQLNRKRGLLSSHATSTNLNESIERFMQQQQQSTASPETISTPPLNQAPELQAALAANPAASGLYLDQWLQSDERTCRQFVHSLRANLDGHQTILLELTAIIKTQPKATEDYYGHPTPVQWSNLLLSTIPAILEHLQRRPDRETLFDVLGNITQDTTDALPILLPHWEFFVHSLPASSYCCAAILQRDQTTYGMNFLNQLQPAMLVELLSSSKKAVDACWMLDGLTRREETVADVLVNPNSNLLNELVRLFQNNTNAEVLVPLCRSLSNILSVEDGKFVVVFLNQPGSVPAVLHGLEARNSSEILHLVNCLLTDVGVPNHASNLFCRDFILALARVLLSGSYEWKCGAVHAIANALLPPLGHQMNGMLLDIVSSLWPYDDSTQQRQIMQALLDLLKAHDNEVLQSTVLVLDALLRNVELSRETFEEGGGIELLEAVCDRASEDTAQRAVSILDDFFDEEEQYNIIEEDSLFPEDAPPLRDFSQGRGRGRVVPAWMQK